MSSHEGRDLSALPCGLSSLDKTRQKVSFKRLESKSGLQTQKREGRKLWVL